MSATLWVLVVILAAGILVFLFPPIRRVLVTRHVLPILARALPRMGDTERIALEAGSVWWEAELFSGNPRWSKLVDFKPRQLTD